MFGILLKGSDLWKNESQIIENEIVNLFETGITGLWYWETIVFVYPFLCKLKNSVFIILFL